MMDINYLTAFKHPSFTLMDPCCGSGTLAIEAALMMTDTAPGLLKYSMNNRPHPVDRWGQDQSINSIWEDVYNNALQRDLRFNKEYQATNFQKKIYANDIHPRAIDLAKDGATAAKVNHLIEFSVGDISNIDLRQSASKMPLPCVMVTNPPWDLRLDEAADVWEALGYFSERNMCGKSV